MSVDLYSDDLLSLAPNKSIQNREKERERERQQNAGGVRPSPNAGRGRPAETATRGLFLVNHDSFLLGSEPEEKDEAEAAGDANDGPAAGDPTAPPAAASSQPAPVASDSDATTTGGTTSVAPAGPSSRGPPTDDHPCLVLTGFPPHATDASISSSLTALSPTLSASLGEIRLSTDLAKGTSLGEVYIWVKGDRDVVTSVVNEIRGQAVHFSNGRTDDGSTEAKESIVPTVSVIPYSAAFGTTSSTVRTAGRLSASRGDLSQLAPTRLPPPMPSHAQARPPTMQQQVGGAPPQGGTDVFTVESLAIGRETAQREGDRRSRQASGSNTAVHPRNLATVGSGAQSFQQQQSAVECEEEEAEVMVVMVVMVEVDGEAEGAGRGEGSTKVPLAIVHGSAGRVGHRAAATCVRILGVRVALHLTGLVVPLCLGRRVVATVSLIPLLVRVASDSPCAVARIVGPAAVRVRVHRNHHVRVTRAGRHAGHRRTGAAHCCHAGRVVGCTTGSMLSDGKEGNVGEEDEGEEANETEHGELSPPVDARNEVSGWLSLVFEAKGNAGTRREDTLHGKVQVDVAKLRLEWRQGRNLNLAHALCPALLGVPLAKLEERFGTVDNGSRTGHGANGGIELEGDGRLVARLVGRQPQHISPQKISDGHCVKEQLVRPHKTIYGGIGGNYLGARGTGHTAETSAAVAPTFVRLAHATLVTI
eukprot:CAMPEP_0170751222 /NCGR_PEP_ID=MMETSP0437-20130122/11341_1 /TAXON_ID=0 /ORGANISM="Sexangularia sp." /LENGTH=702 /DNA_ID=CAMNT_0011090253 /DNA_START=14 /DNA_END=2123 /DNA_ORIENTATION=-